MIWIAWRFQRSVACALALLALILIGVAIVTGVAQHHDLVHFLGPPCHGQQPPGRNDYCGKLAVRLSQVRSYNNFIRAGAYVIAPLVGALIGILALASEVDSRTVRLAWTQSISRSRWFAAKASVGATVVAIILVPIAVTLSWWNGTIGDRSILTPQTFEVAGWDLVAYGLFMFALTVLLGVVIRRVGWTLAATVLLFLVVALVVPSRVRSHLVTPDIKWSEPQLIVNGDFGGASAPFPYNSWLLVNGAVPRSTKGTPTWSEVTSTSSKVLPCENEYPTETQSEYIKAETICYKRLDVENVAVYIADNEFWTLQLREGLLYLSVGVIFVAGALVLVRRIEP